MEIGTINNAILAKNEKKDKWDKEDKEARNRYKMALGMSGIALLGGAIADEVVLRKTVTDPNLIKNFRTNKILTVIAGSFAIALPFLLTIGRQTKNPYDN